MSLAIKIENISKQYRLGLVGTGTMSHDLNRWWARVRGKNDPYSKVGQVNRRDQAADGDYVWALQDIDIEVEQGEVLGIIGRNGAGKSTLLKLLSRITAPTTGSISTRGRIASLLEVGTGFHPELTGRENIYLNGAILGMRRSEITSFLKPIVEFSGCEKYLDTPSKRYSSGMKVRLGFAVAAHLRCDILVVDEVLAVGDAEFQKRCIGKMQELATGGMKTVLFVSHNMTSVSNLCSKCVVLENGIVTATEPTDKAIRTYLEACHAASVGNIEHRKGSGEIRIESVAFRCHGQYVSAVQAGETVEIVLKYRSGGAHESLDGFNFGIVISDSLGTDLAAHHTRLSGLKVVPKESGEVILEVPSLPLNQNEYRLRATVYDQDSRLVDRVERIAFPIEGGDPYGCGELPPATHGSVIFPGAKWQHKESPCP